GVGSVPTASLEPLRSPTLAPAPLSSHAEAVGAPCCGCADGAGAPAGCGGRLSSAVLARGPLGSSSADLPLAPGLGADGTAPSTAAAGPERSRSCTRPITAPSRRRSAR